MRRVNSGVENGKTWAIDRDGSTYLLTVSDNKTGDIQTQMYRCQYAPTFGLDTFDSAEIDRLLDVMLGLTK